MNCAEQVGASQLLNVDSIQAQVQDVIKNSL